MDAQMIRLECLKLAAGGLPGSAPSQIIERAKQLETFVSGEAQPGPAPAAKGAPNRR